MPSAETLKKHHHFAFQNKQIIAVWVPGYLDTPKLLACGSLYLKI